jgi:hypothetical protein
MNMKRVLIASAIAVSLAVAGSVSAQQTGTPKTPQPTGAPHKSTHVVRDICATHPNLPQCS